MYTCMCPYINIASQYLLVYKRRVYTVCYTPLLYNVYTCIHSGIKYDF